MKVHNIVNFIQRDSVCSVGSVKEAQICRKANLAIVNKWQCLVDQMRGGDGHEARRRSSLASVPAVGRLPPLGLGGRHTFHAHSHRQMMDGGGANTSTTSPSMSSVDQPAGPSISSASSSQHTLSVGDDFDTRSVRSAAK